MVQPDDRNNDFVLLLDMLKPVQLRNEVEDTLVWKIVLYFQLKGVTRGRMN